MIYDEMIFQDIHALNSIKQLTIDNNSILVLIQYEDIIDYLLIDNIKADTLKQLAYYLFIAYDIRSFNTDMIKFINVYDNQLIDNIMCISILNDNQMIYDHIQIDDIIKRYSSLNV